jgi:hypothetical protein
LGKLRISARIRTMRIIRLIHISRFLASDLPGMDGTAKLLVVPDAALEPTADDI